MRVVLVAKIPPPRGGDLSEGALTGFRRIGDPCADSLSGSLARASD